MRAQPPDSQRRWRRFLGLGTAVAVLCAVLVSFSSKAGAGPFDVYGFGPRALGMSDAVTAIADDYTAVFYNPANLVLRKQIHLGAEFLVAIPSLSINVARFDPAYSPVDASTYYGFSLGALFPLGGKLDYRFALGLGLHFPTQQLLRVDSMDPLVPRWYLTDSLAKKFQFILALGVEIMPWLSVGVGVQTLAGIAGGTTVEVDWFNEELPHRTVRSDMLNVISPLVGLRLGPLHGFTFGCSWRSELGLFFEMPILFDFGDSLQATLITEGHALYTPHTISFGLAWEIFDSGWLVSSELRRAFWSLAPDPALYFALDIGGELVEALAAEEAFDFLPGPSGLSGFNDTWSIHTGVEVAASKNILGRIGYSYRPTPLPPQEGLSNYIDNDRHNLSLGIGVRIPDPLGIGRYPLIIELSASFSVLPTQTVQKASSDDPIGDLSHGGELLGLNVSLRHDY